MTETVDRPLWADDGVLADRVRSVLGAVSKQFDQPRIHVMATGTTVLLHGEVSDLQAKAALEAAASAVPGVGAVQSHLHVGLLPGDTLPSEGRAAELSPLLHRLRLAARDCGFLVEAEQSFVLRGVLSVFVARLPRPLRRRLLDHLPGDVRLLARPQRFADSASPGTASEHELVHVAALAAATDPDRAERLLARVLPMLAEHCPEDKAVVAAALPPEMAQLWSPAAAAALSSRRQSALPRIAATSWLRAPVSTVMSRNVVTVRTDATLFEAFDAMTRARVHHLPVVRDDGRCVALLDAVTIAERLPEAWVSHSTVMVHRAGTPGPLSVLETDSLGRAAQLISSDGDACCVVDGTGRLVGLVTSRDLVAAMAAASRHA